MPQFPFFSVIIPTKNRSNRVGNAIQSVLNQTFGDFEIILVNNDDDPDATQEVISSFSDSRIRCFRTGNLSMADNWDYGRQQAKGQYIKYLPDRQLLKSWALETIYKAVEHENHLIVSWDTDDLDDQDENQVFFKVHHTQATKEHSRHNTKDLLRLFLHSNRALSWRFLPRGINSVCHSSLVETIVNGPAGRLCHPAAPDFTMAYLQLAYADELLYIDEALNVSCSGVSGGREFRLKSGKAGSGFIKDTGEDKFYNNVPVKTLATQNMLYNDYANIRAFIPEILNEYPIPLVEYFVLTYADIRLYELVGVKTATELAAWDSALKMQSPSIQVAVKKAIRPFELKYMVTLGNRIDLRWLQQAIRFYRRLRRQNFPSVLAALEWDKQVMHPNDASK